MHLLKSTVAILTLSSLSTFAQASSLFDDTDWRITAYLSNGGVTANQYTENMSVNFNNGQYSGTGVCNSFSGTYNLAPKKKLRFSPPGSTLMACPSTDADKEERNFLNDWAKVTGYRIEGKNITLINKRGEIVMTLSPIE